MHGASSELFQGSTRNLALTRVESTYAKTVFVLVDTSARLRSPCDIPISKSEKSARISCFWNRQKSLRIALVAEADGPRSDE